MLNNIQVNTRQDVKMNYPMLKILCDIVKKQLISTKILQQFKITNNTMFLSYIPSSKELYFNEKSCYINIQDIALTIDYLISSVDNLKNQHIVLIDKNNIITDLNLATQPGIFNLDKYILLQQLRNLNIKEYEYLYWNNDILKMTLLTTILQKYIHILNIKQLNNLFNVTLPLKYKLISSQYAISAIINTILALVLMLCLVLIVPTGSFQILLMLLLIVPVIYKLFT